MQFERRGLGNGFPVSQAKTERRGETSAAKRRNYAAYSLSSDEARGAGAEKDQAQDPQQNLRPRLAEEEKGVRGWIRGSCEAMHRREHDAVETHQGPTVAESESGRAAEEIASSFTKRQQERPACHLPDGLAALIGPCRCAESATTLQFQQRTHAGAGTARKDATISG